METKQRFAVSAAPHIFAKDTTSVLMLDVIAALMPTVAAGIWLFGWAAARFDDLINLPASRLSGVLFLVAASLVPGASPARGWQAIRRDAHHHRSPNAGWPEAALAGALGFALAGPRSYGGQMIEATYMGEGGRRDLCPADIRRAVRLTRLASWLLIALFGGLAVLTAT